jgi:urease accessory protein
MSAWAWIQSGLQHVLATNELPMLAFLYRDWDQGHYSEVNRLDGYFLASRESFELRQETEQMGWSLAQLALAALNETNSVCRPSSRMQRAL